MVNEKAFQYFIFIFIFVIFLGQVDILEDLNSTGYWDSLVLLVTNTIGVSILFQIQNNANIAQVLVNFLRLSWNLIVALIKTKHGLDEINIYIGNS